MVEKIWTSPYDESGRMIVKFYFLDWKSESLEELYSIILVKKKKNTKN